MPNTEWEANNFDFIKYIHNFIITKCKKIKNKEFIIGNKKRIIVFDRNIYDKCSIYNYSKGFNSKNIFPLVKYVERLSNNRAIVSDINNTNEFVVNLNFYSKVNKNWSPIKHKIGPNTFIGWRGPFLTVKPNIKEFRLFKTK